MLQREFQLYELTKVGKTVPLLDSMLGQSGPASSCYWKM